MRVAIIGLVFIASACLIAAAMAADAPLILERTIPLEGVSGRIDHLAIDQGRERLLVAELGNNSVDVVDLRAGKVIHRIGELKEPQGLAYLAQQDLIVVANAGDGSVQFFRGDDFSALGTLALGDDADNIRIDPATGHILVGYGSGALAVIDPVSRSKLDDIRLAGHPESFQPGGDKGRVFVNVPDARHVAVVDLKARKQTLNWKTPGLGSNFPMALSDADGRLAVVFRSPAKLALLDTATGAVAASLDTCGDVATFVITLLCLGGLGVVTQETVWLFLVGLPALGGGTWLGWTFYGRLDEASFRSVVLMLLFLSGLALVISGK